MKMEVATEKYITLKEAANALGLPYWKLQRAAKLGMIKTYTFLNSRQYVVISELRGFIASRSQGG
jgi:hypothetical protein